jgi:hypothetical protein
MSHDKNLINQIKYKSVKNNPSARASQEIPYTALDPLITVNDNVLFSIVDQDNAVNNKMTVLQLRQYIKSTMNLYKSWTVADGNTLTLTEDELNSNQKIFIITEDLSSLTGDFELIIPDTWDDTQGISIEIDYSASLFSDFRVLAIKDNASFIYYNSFVFYCDSALFGAGNNAIGRCNYFAPPKFKFKLQNGQLRHPFGCFSVIALASQKGNGGFLPAVNNINVGYKINTVIGAGAGAIESLGANIVKYVLLDSVANTRQGVLLNINLDNLRLSSGTQINSRIFSFAINLYITSTNYRIRFPTIESVWENADPNTDNTFLKYFYDSASTATLSHNLIAQDNPSTNPATCFFFQGEV